MKNKIRQIYGWLDDNGEYYFISKCLKWSNIPYQDKRHVQAPTDPDRIRILKDFENEDEYLEFLDGFFNVLGFTSDYSGTL